MKHRKAGFIATLLILLTIKLFAQSNGDKIKSAFTKFSEDSQLKYAISTFVVKDKNTGSIIFKNNENIGLAPASSLKTVTSATAFALLGENYQFQTDFSYTGSIIDGVLKGNLLIKGNGDPTLGSNRFSATTKIAVLNKIVEALKLQGITKIEGEVIVDDGIWDSQSIPEGWIWQDMGNYYGAGTSAVCWGENEFELRFKPGSVGSNVEILNGSDHYPFINIINEIKTGGAGTGDQVYGYSSPYASEVYLRGTYAVNLNKAIRFSLPDAALVMAYEIQQGLIKNNIPTLGYQTTRILKKQNQLSSFNDKKILSLSSPPLKEIVYHFNQKSLNLYGEQLVRVMASDEGHTIKNGVQNIENYWQKQGVDKKSMNLYDGSGLSPANRITALSMTDVLMWASKQPWFSSYYNSLPLNNNMKMKSGTIGDVLAYAGYHNNYCFVIMVNNYNGITSSTRQKIFELLDILK